MRVKLHASDLQLKDSSLIIIDLVWLKDGHHEELRYFLENNWLAFRKEAQRKGYIKSYRLIKNHEDTATSADYVLLTEYGNMESYRKREVNFRVVMKTVIPNGANF